VSASSFLQAPLRSLKGVGPRRAADLQRAGLLTVEDLLCRFPCRYEDRSHFQSIGDLEPGETASVAAEVVDCGVRLTRRPGFKLFSALVRDGSGALRVAWLNQPYMRNVIRRHQRLVLFGTVEVGPSGALQMTNPDYEAIDDEEHATFNMGRIVPIYEKVGSLSPKVQRRLVDEAIASLDHVLPDPLPLDLRASKGLPGRREAFVGAHFPPDGTSLELLHAFRTPAQVRMIFEEYFLFQLGLLERRRESDTVRKPAVPVVDDRVRDSVRAVLPFHLTGGQRQALAEIVGDLQRPQPMNRLLQGDVGAGKTIVALAAAVVEMANGLQVAFMAPTEILAEQHYLSLRRLLDSSRYRVALVTGGMPAAARRRVLEALEAGDVDLAVGTHALLEEGVRFRRLGLVVIDEQHRFGVLQRATLREKGPGTDVLVMTATPIPRTLALTLYGDLDISVIRELPPGRQPIRTTARPESRREEVYAFVREQLAQGRQAYVVYPLVDDSSKVDLKAATAMADHLAGEVFPEFRVALLHGRMKPDGKDRVMRAFAGGDIDLLVATTVIEVGIDVPNASVIVIEHAERFGLSQLHQLRGRVGRGPHPSHCVLLYQSPLSADARARLEAMAETTDGFIIAERDLQIRGAGDFFGTRQSGMPTFRVGDLQRDRPFMEEARASAVKWLDEGTPDPVVLESVRETWAHRFSLAGVG
jgi:ATP-dependent DNA helicase RecG